MVYSLISDVSKETLPLLTKLVETICFLFDYRTLFLSFKTPINVVSILSLYHPTNEMPVFKSSE